MKTGILTQTTALLILLTAAPLIGESILKDPMIPNGETAVYMVHEGDKQFTVIEEVSITEENERNIYSFVYKSDNETTEVKIERLTMVPFSVHSVNVGNGISIDSSTRLSFERQIQIDGVPVLSFTDLKYVLRGYPFGEIKEDLDIEFINTTDENESSFVIRIRYIETEELRLDERIIECHKLQLRFSGSGMMRVIKPFIPKTYFWYSAEPPHYLVAYRGGSGFGGSDTRQLEIIDYSGWN